MKHALLAAPLSGKAWLQALELFQVGSPAAQCQADTLLWELGCRVRLTSAAFLDESLQPRPCESMPAAPRVFEDVLPGAPDAGALPHRACVCCGDTSEGLCFRWTVSEPPRQKGPVTVVLAGALLRSLQDGFAQDSLFWREHNYFDPDTPFFSYFYSLVRSGSVRHLVTSRFITVQFAPSLHCFCTSPTEQPRLMFWAG